jgi:hypothetical protein
VGDEAKSHEIESRGAIARAGTEGEGREAMTTRAQARSLLERLRRMPNATPTKLLAEFRRLLAKGKAR